MLTAALRSRGNLERIPAGISKYSQCSNLVHITQDSCGSAGCLMILNTFDNPSAKRKSKAQGRALAFLAHDLLLTLLLRHLPHTVLQAQNRPLHPSLNLIYCLGFKIVIVKEVERADPGSSAWHTLGPCGYCAHPELTFFYVLIAPKALTLPSGPAVKGWHYTFVHFVVVVCSCIKVDFAFCDLTPGRNSARPAERSELSLDPGVYTWVVILTAEGKEAVIAGLPKEQLASCPGIFVLILLGDGKCKYRFSCEISFVVLLPFPDANGFSGGRLYMKFNPFLMSDLDMSLHRQMGSDRDLQSSASSVSLPSVKKAPKKRRISLGSLFRRKKDTKRKSRDLNGGVDGIASIESIHSEMCTDKNSIFSTCTSSDNGTTSSSKPSGDFMECPLCLLRHSKDRFPEIMTCHHRSCVDCLRQYLRIEISESRVNISCPECSERFNPHDIRLILNDDILMEKYEEFMLRRWLVADPDCRWCPAPDCGYAVIAFGCASCPKLTCGREGCGTEFCYHCKQIWHPNQTCDAARQERAQSLRLRTIRSSSISYSQESGAAADDIKPCPRCAAYIIKMNDGSCNHMTCAVCGCEFCWLCMKEISDLHYLSPSGCTFWGKKPWSRKKKILWQLGTLVGAPVGIALIAGIAIPAMIIGIPVYVGRKNI
ncbi:hypothetical protein llap_10659 [Limosa lapponica baueri]|uniref:RBR-type E3 ubiquitin transferase n=1 Tax=Limosa lapponica baueri TaxID=1758121 RepID=A0A2I0TZ39_LIMLA|nr:hypothetical protein llap_10659 [Limosa lapponica baueri]